MRAGHTLVRFAAAGVLATVPVAIAPWAATSASGLPTTHDPSHRLVATSAWSPPVVVVPAPASTDVAAATDPSGATLLFAGDRVYRERSGLWSAERVPYAPTGSHMRVLAAAGDATGTYLVFETAGSQGLTGIGIRLGKRSPAGAFSAAASSARRTAGSRCRPPP